MYVCMYVSCRDFRIVLENLKTYCPQKKIVHQQLVERQSQLTANVNF